MRISDCPHPNEQRAFRENAYLQWMTCLSCGVPLESKDGPGRHSGEDGTDNRTTSVDTPCPGCASTTRLQQMTNKTETFCRLQSVHHCAKECYTHLLLRNTCFTVCALMFSSSAYGGAGDGTDSDSVGSEESFTMLNVPAESASTQQEQQFLLDSYGIFGLLASRVRKHDGRSFECFQTSSRRSRVSKAVRKLQDTMQKI